MTISVISTPSTQFTIPPNQALTVENLGPGTIHWGRFAVDDAHNEGVILPSNTITFFAPFGPQVFLACDTPTSISTTFIPFPQAAPILGTDGTVGGPSGSPLSPSVVTNSQLAVNVLDPQYGAKGDGVTNDSAAIQAAINAANAKATSNQIVDVLLPPGYGFSIGSRLVPKNNVRLVAYGATILPNWASIGNLPLMNNTSATLLTGFGIYGGYWAGTGTETGNQVLFAAGIFGSGLGIQRARFTDMEITNWPLGILYLVDPYKVIVDHCRMDTVCVNGGANAISFYEVDDAANVGQVIASDNIITNCAAGSIAYVKSAGTATRDVQAIFARNIVSGTSATGNALNGGLDVEVANASATVKGFLLEGNHVVGGNSNGGWAINMGNVSQGTIQGVRIRGNRIEGPGASGVGIHVGAAASVVDAEDNTILTTNKYGGAGAVNASNNTFVDGSVRSGKATLVAGTVTVSTTEVVAGDKILLTVVSASGTRGEVQVGTITAGTSFVINSIQPGTTSTLQASDTSTVFWKIDH